ncbi:hypothetical protein EPO17_02040 [Patescibacteria group bacterium]|nr:MAG: hypothetical protein EPO17_02040 [Patescibacteria group bacterium]
MNEVPFLNVEYFFSKIYEFFTGKTLARFWNWCVEVFYFVLPYAKWIAIVISLLCLTGIIYAILQLRRLNEEIQEKYMAEYESLNAVTVASDGGNLLRWSKITEHAESLNPNDWMSAILEADIILDELLEKEGAIGDGVGEKLRSLTRGNLRTLDNAWEAHRMRNNLAHGGAAVLLNNREVKRILALYQTVFEELKFI